MTVSTIEPATLPRDGIFTIQQGLLSIGRVFRVIGQDGRLAAYVKHPIMKLREEFNIFADEAETTLLAKAKVRKLVQINTCYDVTSGATGAVLCTFQRRALKSLLRDRFEILDAAGQPVGAVDETGFALLHRFFKWWPRQWAITLGGAPVGMIRQHFTLVRKKITLDLTGNGGKLDPLAALTCTLVLLHEVHSASARD